MAKHDSLLRHVDLRKQIPGSKEMLKLSRSPVVVAFDKVNCPAGQPLSIGSHMFRSSHAEIPKEIKNIVWFSASVDTLADHVVHFLRIPKRTIAVPNNVEVAEMKIGREPDTAHGFILVDLRTRRHPP
jgi:hypothetical protein